MSGSPLTTAERQRYHRQIILSEVGESGQQKIKAAKVVIIGLGGLGAPCATYLASAGIGRLTLVDHDDVDISNLHRQILFTEADVGRQKTEVTLERIRALNPTIETRAVDCKVHPGNIRDIIGDNDIVVDCTDNFRTRYVINDACAATKTLLVQASILQFEAQLSVFCSEEGPCYRCLYPEAPPTQLAPSCAEAGVMGVLPGILGAYQANEALKLVLGIGTPLVGKLALFGVLENRFDLFEVTKKPDCPACSAEREMAELDQRHVAPAPEIWDGIRTIKPSELKRLMRSQSDLQIVDVRSAGERREQGWIENDVAIALPDLPRRLERLDRNRPVVCYCLSGQRSLQAAELLIQNGFRDVQSLHKGILGWGETMGAVLAPRP